MKLKGYKLETTAEKKAEELGCEGTHKHGEVFMPCKSHKQYVSKSKEPKKQYVSKSKEPKKELDELIDFDGTMNSSKIPFGLNPKLHPRKTMDQTIPNARITNDPLSRGFRAFGAYFSPSLKEVNFEDAFGYEETKFMDAEDTIKYLEKELGMDVADAEDRTIEFGKKSEMDEKSPYKDDPNFVSRSVLKEREIQEEQRQKAIKMVEDILVRKSSKDNDVSDKEPKTSKILQRNIKSIKKLADKEGLTMSELLKLIKNL
jgi:hypothetical protein